MGDRGTDPLRMGPIYIGGAARSGKTLMRWILSSHPHIVVTRRTEMWTRFYGRFGDLANPVDLERCLRSMLARRHIAELGTDLDRLRRDLHASTPTYGRLFALFHEQYAERCGKTRWGDQTGYVERFAPEIFAQDPLARFLHLIRDPRDVFGAVIERRRRKPGSVGRIAATWRSSASFARRNQQRYLGRYEVVRYEDLVADPDATIRGVCAFLGERFEPTMLQMEQVRRYDDIRAGSEDGSPISDEFVGRYRRSVDRSDVGLIQSLLEPELNAFGYPPDPIRLSPADRLRHAASWPLRVTRIGSSA
jgi:hypothetical protein